MGGGLSIKGNPRKGAVKTCPKCCLTKPVSDFSKDNGRGDGLYYYCKQCVSVLEKAYVERNKDKDVVIPDFKICSVCKLEKAGFSFSRSRRSPDGLCYCCKVCASNANKANNQKLKDRENVIVPDLKTCPRCKTEKSSLGFSKKANRKDGLSIYCKVCNSELNKIRQEKNRSRELIVIPDFALCFRCKKEKPGVEFGKNSDAIRGIGSYCKECKIILDREWLYGVTEEQFNAMLEAQGGACAICKFVPGSNDKRLCLDHNHLTNIPRGLLCDKCNRGLGFFKDSGALLTKVGIYLRCPTLEIKYKQRIDKVIRDSVLSSQGYLCKICSADLHGKKACLDHCHLTGMVRGYLCHGCNCGLGQFNDDAFLIGVSIDYLCKC